MKQKLSLLHLFGEGNSCLYEYGKDKVEWLKAIFPIAIILHHVSNKGIEHLEFFGYAGNFVMYFFFAMSGFDFELTDEEMKAIDSININNRLRFDPDNLDFHSVG